MARFNVPLLGTDERFPDLEIQPVEHDRLQLPGDLAGGYSVLLIYRGHW